jgi:hypothetical protein
LILDISGDAVQHHVQSQAAEIDRQGDQAMDTIGGVILGATLFAAGAAYAQSPSRPDQSGSAVTQAPYYYPTPPLQGESQRRPLFTFGGVNVDVWAPVEPPYDPHIDRSAAADPFWGGDAP